MADTTGRRRSGASTVAAVVAALLLAALTVSSVLAGRDATAEARRATARFNSVVQAERAGYGPFPSEVPLGSCIEALDGSGAMGVHWVNGSLLDGVLDPAAPEVLVYAPRPNGTLELVALEYVVFDADWQGAGDPMLFGQRLTPVPSPNRYEIPAFWQIHLWLYEPNRDGLFADFNPSVSC
jgi:hypothetical protein